MSDFEGQRPEHQGSYEALLEMGSVPTQSLHEINDAFDGLDQSIQDSAPKKQKLGILLRLAAATLCLAACGGSLDESLKPYGPTGMAADIELSNAMAQSSEGQQGVAAPALAAEQQSAPEKEYIPAYAVIQQGEGVIQALHRVSGAQPHQIAPEQIIEILHIGDPTITTDDWLEVYNWPALLRLNPRVDIGDHINDTLTPELSVAYPVSPENSHLE